MKTKILAITICLSYTGMAYGYSFVPTESEWASWPAYCKARYASIPAADGGAFGKRVSKAEIAKWKKTIGWGTFEHVHHACWGYVLANKALYGSGKDRSYIRKRAVGELTYTYSKMPKARSPLLAKISEVLAEVKSSQGKAGEAVKILLDAIAYQPANLAVYRAKARYHENRKQYDDAIATLKQAENKVKERRKKMVYALIGYTALRAKKYDVAIQYAKKAYDAGYKNSKLRRKLKKSGHSIQ